MTPIPAELREKWQTEAMEHPTCQTVYLMACEARHREYQERVATTAKDFAQWFTEDRWKEEHLAERSLSYAELWDLYIQYFPPQP